MKGKEDVFISGALNQLLLFIISGADYASKIAKKTDKSIPVVYKQLEILITKKLINKKRSGKKVVYYVNWDNLTSMISSLILLDFKELSKLINDSDKKNEELTNLMKDIPKEYIENDKKLSNAIKNFFEEDVIASAFKDFVIRLDELGNDFVRISKMAFNSTIDYLLDTFGMLSVDEQKTVMNKLNDNDSKVFMKLCRARYLHKLTLDPRTDIISSIKNKI